MSVSGEISRRRLCLAARAPGLTAARLAALAQASPDLELLEHPDMALLAGLGLTNASLEWLRAPDPARIDSDLRWLESSDCAVLPAISPAYPELLRQSPDAPAVLFVRGNAAVLAEPQIAMVGSRNPTAGGRATARD